MSNGFNLPASIAAVVGTSIRRLHQSVPAVAGLAGVLVASGDIERAKQTLDMLPAPPSLLVCDASFISLEKLLEVPLSLAAPEADFVGLFKPQFQVGRENIGKGGIVTDEAAADAAAERFAGWMNEKGWPILAWTASPISGGDGNPERLFHAVKAQ